MAEPVVLRVGVCSCSERYRGRLNNQIVTAGRRRFLLREVSIPEDENLETLLISRCHFFVDLHYGDFLTCVKLTRPKGDFFLLLISMKDTVRRIPNYRKPEDGFEIREYGTARELRRCRRRPPPRGEILRAIVVLLKTMRGKMLNQWLERMTL